MAVLTPSEWREREESHAGFPFRVTSYRLGEVFRAQASNVSPDAVIGRAEGTTREEAEARVIEIARRRLARTRVQGAAE
jgi:hypothetical protein